MRNTLAFTLLLATSSLSAEPLLQATQSWDGGDIAYPEGEAEITSVILRIEEGQEPPFHCHPVPTMGYVLNGTAEIETSEGKRKRVGPGEPLVEVMNTVHRGKAVDGPVEIVVFYAGAVDTPVTVKPEDDPEGRYCKL